MVTRRELHDLVWSKPMTKVAEGFGVSGSYMARVCLTLHVPCPPRGYWAKLAAGRAPAPTPLPDARPGDPEVWTKDERLLPRGMRKPSILRRKDVLRRDRPDRHPLLLGACGSFVFFDLEAGFPSDMRQPHLWGAEDDSAFMRHSAKSLLCLTTLQHRICHRPLYTLACRRDWLEVCYQWAEPGKRKRPEISA